jgi:hypothetical protein
MMTATKGTGVEDRADHAGYIKAVVRDLKSLGYQDRPTPNLLEPSLENALAAYLPM